MTKPIRVRMAATFLLRTYVPDWRDDADLDVADRVLGALFEEVEVSYKGEEVGPCSCSMDAEDYLTTGEPSITDPDCPWHGEDR